MERMTRFRAMLLLLFVAAVLGVFSIQLFSMQIVDAEENADNTTVYITYTTVRAARGDILDTKGNKLVSNRASYDLVFNHYVILNCDDPNGVLLQLAHLCRDLGIEYADHFPITREWPFEYTLSEYNAAWQGYFQAYLKSRGNLDSDITAQLLMEALRESYEIPADWSDEDARLVLGMRYELSLRASAVTNLPNYVFIEDTSQSEMSAILELNVPGLKVEDSTVREYYTEYAAHVLGYVAPMTSSQMEEYPDYPMDALVGQDGFELAFEAYLHATDGVRVDHTTKDGTVVKSYYETEPKAGNHVEVSIDLAMQIAGEDALADTIEALRDEDTNQYNMGYDAQGGAVVAIDVKTGQVLVCASYPSYDLSNFNEDYNEIMQQPYKPLINRALRASYPPGSTFKVCMVVAGIDSGTISRYDLIYDEGVYTKYEGFEANCLLWTTDGLSHGNVNSMTALKHSCNYYFYELADRMNIEDIDSTAKAFGLGESTGVELYEETGQRANPETKLSVFAGTNTSGWYAADQVMTGIGQSLHEYTPMQLASYCATLANRGIRYKATFLNRVVSSDFHTLVEDNKAEILNKLEISDEAYAAYLEGMQMVLQGENDSASVAFKDYPVKVAAKTGTAEVSGGSDNGAFICFAPADDPQIAIAVYGEHVGAGGIMASVARSIMDAYFGINSGDVDNFENQLS